MYKIFVPLYHFFERHRLLMYATIAVTTVVFVIFGLKVRLEEDITKLIPSTGSSEKGLAFGSLRVKDKIFVQVASREGAEVELDTLISYVDSFAGTLVERDARSHNIDGILYNTDGIDFPTILDSLKAFFPIFIDESAYAQFDSLMTPQRAAEQMEWNLLAVSEELPEDDPMVELAGDDLAMYSLIAGLPYLDPLGFRGAFADGISANSGIGSFTLLSREDDDEIEAPRYFVSKDKTVAYLFISPCFASTDTGAGTDLVDMIREEAEAFNAAHSDAEVLFHGAPVRSVNNSNRIKKDLLLTIGLSLLVILILITTCFKDWKVIPFQLLPVGYGTFFALACVYWIKGGMSLLAMGIGAIVLGVALSYCLHIITHFKYLGDPEQVLHDESTPVVLGVLTTVGAFLGLLFTQSELLRDFGIFASLALLGSTLFALIFLPHFFRKGDTGKNWKAFRVIDRISAFSIDKRHLPMAIVFVVTILCICFSPKVSFDKDLRNLSYFEEETLRSEKLYADMNFRSDSINAYYAAADPDLDKALLHNSRIIRTVDSLQRCGIVHHYSGITSKIFIPEEIQRRRIDAWNAYWTPEKQAQARETVLSAAADAQFECDWDNFPDFEEMISQQFDPSATFNVYESGLFPESVTSNFIEYCDGRYLVFTPVQCAKVEEKDAISDIVTQKGMSDHAIAVDPMYYIRDMVEIVHRDFDIAVAISSIFVFLVLLLSFHSIWSALLSFLPMALSWYVVKGAMVLLGLQFNLINIVISTFIFGIGVDYSIFVMEGLLSFARTGSSKLLVWHKSAIFFSAVVLLIVMASLLFAVHPSISSIGLSALIGMATTVIFTYTIQPWIFRKMMRYPYFQRCFRK